MKYRHEQIDYVYRELRALNRAVAWKGGSFDDFDLRDFLEQAVSTLTFSSTPPRALEYGTGTGAGACFLAARGFRVDAIDLSPTAITLARQFAAERDLQIVFEVGDICGFRPPNGAYDLIVDNYCRQCLVTDLERQKALANVRSLLKSEGRFLIGSVIHRDGRDFGREILDERTGILYARLEGDPERYEDAVKLNGCWYFPRRRIIRPAALRTEIEGAGFTILWQEGGRLICTAANE
jgi:SAM-dependent methyltransferase